ncbi:MAG: hypothetical protein GXP04_15440 [Alphaproteobacteria bacterium]|nr:hypothetical protein [Alphaproteobacteria bacterium]
MIKKIFTLFLLALCAGISGCTPTPSGIPRDAERSWSLKGSFNWKWNQNVERGCIAWVAKESYAVVYVFVDEKCDGERDWEFFQDKLGVDYTSFSDQLLFMGYSSWKPNSVKGENGEYLDWPEYCPYSLSQSQINAIRAVVTDVLGLALTDGERRMLHRVDKRLAKTDGSALRVSYLGCVDVVNDRKRNESGLKVDPWENNSRSD